jgi:hypothetical protein
MKFEFGRSLAFPAFHTKVTAIARPSWLNLVKFFVALLTSMNEKEEKGLIARGTD